MNIVFDLDDTLFHNFLSRDTAKKYGVPQSEYFDLRDYHQEALEDWKLKINDLNIMGNLPVIEGSAEIIKKLSKKHKLYCVSARPMKSYDISLKMIKRAYPQISKLILNENKIAVFNYLKPDVVFDDKYENIIAAIKSGVKYAVLISNSNTIHNFKHLNKINNLKNTIILDSITNIFSNSKLKEVLK